MQKFRRKTNGLTQPVHHQGLQLSAGGRTGPGEAQTVDAVRQHVAEQGGVGVEGREVGVHVGGLPVGHPGHDAPLDVAEDGVEVLALMRSMVRQHLPEVAGLNVREDSPVSDVLEIVRNVVHHLLPWVNTGYNQDKPKFVFLRFQHIVRCEGERVIILEK